MPDKKKTILNGISGRSEYWIIKISGRDVIFIAFLALQVDFRRSGTKTLYFCFTF
jgi:hypothetical protein